MAAVSVSVPGPALVKLKPVPEITPPTVSELVTETARLAFSVTAPVPRFKVDVPLKEKSAFQI